MNAAVSPSAPRILIVDDHRKIRDPLAVYLRSHSFEVRTAEDAEGMWQLLQQQSFDVIVLDVMLPDGDGFELCHRLHRRDNIPVILLTARDTRDDRVRGLDIGADDYVTKPFDPRELVARINSLLRRRGNNMAAPRVIPVGNDTQRHEFSGMSFTACTGTLLRTDGTTVRLSTVESRLLAVFLAHPNQVLSRQRLIDLTTRPDHEVFDRAIDRQISRLRRKLGDNPAVPELLRTIWGDGYLLAASVTTHS